MGARASAGGLGVALRVLRDPLLLGALLVLVAFPFAARVAASRQADAPQARAAPALTAARPGLRALPAFTPRSAYALAPGADALRVPAAMHAAVRAAAAAVLPPAGRRVLARFVRHGLPDGTSTDYPYRFAGLDGALDRAGLGRPTAGQARAANDLGALLVLAAARFPEPGDGFSGAGAAAFAVLSRVRSGGACLPQLNLALLLATDPQAEGTEPELRRAARACPGDPTPLWLLGERRSQQAVAGSGAPTAAARTFALLRRALPGAAAGWSGPADDELRRAYVTSPSRLFTVRRHFTAALAGYRRALVLDPGDPGLLAGRARAEAGLRRYPAAIASQRAAVAGTPGSAPLLARLGDYLERGHAWAAAAATAARLSRAAFPAGPAIVPAPHLLYGEGILGEDADGPLSSGAGTVTPVELSWAPRGPIALPSEATAVSDFSFLPAFRDAGGLTRTTRWCPAWSERRDRLLAGAPAAVLRGLPHDYADIRPEAAGQPCDGVEPEDVALIAAVARLEAHRRPARGGPRGATVRDAAQNLWRYAGDLRRAQVVTAAWIRNSPRASLPVDRDAEIRHLLGDENGAAAGFAKAVRLAREHAGTWSLPEAEALTKGGTVLELAGRYPEALATLAAADETASRLIGLRRTARGDRAAADGARAAFLTFAARAQTGDTLLRTHAYRAADEAYDAARENDPLLAGCLCDSGRRPEAVDNNQALVEVQLGDRTGALRHAARAVAADPRSPLFLQTLGLARARAGMPRAAAQAYAAALRSDPTLYPAAIDLGVVLAGEGHDAAATAAFRRALRVRDDTATAWFDLGVVLERRGPAHVVAAQGAFARAFALDGGLRARRHHLVPDTGILFAKLDLSKPLPPHWSYTDTTDRAPVPAAGFAVALLLALRLGRRRLLGGGGGAKVRGWLDRAPAAIKRVLGTGPATAAVLATLAVFLLPGLRAHAAAGDLLLTGVTAALLVLVVVRGRRAAARAAGAAIRQRGWTPGVLAGLAAAAAGAPWAPLPVVEPASVAKAVHWIGWDPLESTCRHASLSIL